MSDPEQILRIGLLGASRIAVPAIIDAARGVAGIEVAAVAASSSERASDYARQHGIPGVCEGYEALVADPRVDLVYNALAASDHSRWSIAALQQGKAVLCEKPFAMNAREAREMVSAAEATGMTLIEAFHYRFHPLFERILMLLSRGAVGDIRSIAASFNVTIPYSPREIRHHPDLGGGALMDLGCYPLHWLRTIMGEEPEVLSAEAIQASPGIDDRMLARLRFPTGCVASIECSMRAQDPNNLGRIIVTGSEGNLVAHDLIAPNRCGRIVLRSADRCTTEYVGERPTYHHQLLHVLGVLRGNIAPITGGSDAIGNMQLIDSIYSASGLQPRGA